MWRRRGRWKDARCEQAQPKEFRDYVVRIAQNREPSQQLKKIAADWGLASRA